jgi:hypothetical protein
MMVAKVKVKDLQIVQRSGPEALVIRYNDSGTTVTGPIDGISHAIMIGLPIPTIVIV